MTWPTTSGQDSAEDVAGQVTALLDRLRGRAISFRSLVNGGSFGSLDVQDFYSLLSETNTYIEGKKNVVGLTEAIKRRFPGATTFDPAVEWPAMKTPIVNLALWIQQNMERSANGRPTFQEYQAGTGQLVQFTVTINAGTKTTLLGLIDALLARFG